MEEVQDDGQSPSVWGSMQDLTSWGINDHEEGEGSAQNYTAGPGNDLKRAGTTVSKRTIGNTLRHHGLKSYSARKVPLLKPAHVQARLKFANDHLDDPEEEWEKVMWSDETKIELFGLNSTRRVWRKKKDEYNPKNTIKIIQCDFLDVSFRFRLSQLKCTFDKKLQTSTCFVSRKTCKIGSVSNTCSPHCI